MQPSIPLKMKAAAIHSYGGPEVFQAESLPVPKPKADEVLIRLDSAGVGVWDPYIRSGAFEIGPRHFPKVIGNDGAGEVVAVGARVTQLKPGDRVYAFSMVGGFYAEYAAVKAESVAKLPAGLSVEQAGALGADGMTALRGLQDVLNVAPGQLLLIFGASGGIGHLAVQLAKRMGAKVFAVASGQDGVDLVRKLGADEAVDGKHGALAEPLRRFAPQGIDAALVLAHGKGLEAALGQVKKGGRIAFPNGVEPAPEAPEGVTARAYDGLTSPEAFERLNTLISKGPFHVEVRYYALADAAQAHRDVEKHHLGKLALRMH
jgi:NADPH:quinone reductase-like Zn-dependent oxidoreductase